MLKKNKRGLIFLVIIFCLFSLKTLLFSASSDLKPTMKGFSQELMDLKPYLANPKLFESKKSEKIIQKKIKNLRTLAEVSSHKGSLKQDEYRSLVQALIEHLNLAEKNFNWGKKDYSRYMLQATTQLCIGCHAKLPFKEGMEFSLPDHQIKRTTSFQEAEFLFATRQIKPALASFNYLISHYPKKEEDIIQLMKALNYSSIIFARILRDPIKGREFFEKVAKRKNLPPFMQSDVEAWIESFKKWEKEKVLNTQKASDKKIITTVLKILNKNLNNPFFLKDNSNQITYLRASGLLHELLILHPKSSYRAQALYLLGICYLTLDNEFYTDLQYSYFKTCIKEYPQSPFAKKCYDLLAESVVFGYSGSSGIHIPPDVEQELNALRSLLKI